MPVQCTCSYCGATLSRSPSRARKTTRQFCNAVCQNASPSFVCAHCDATFTRNASRIKSERVYCTPSCQLEAHRLSLNVETDFWPMFNRAGPIPPHRPELGPCWVWTGKTNPPSGYGVVSDGGKRRYVHRLSYTLTNGAIPDGLHVLHHCDNPPCGRPSHLFVGTHADNMRDMALKGRNRSVPLTDEDILYIWEAPRGYGTGKALALKFGVSDTTISGIRHGQRLIRSP